MSSRDLFACLFGLVVWALTLAPRVSRAEPLTLEDVLESVAETHPTIERAGMSVARADGEALAARGGFDPVLSIRGLWSPIGYYDNGQVETQLRQPTPLWGASVYAGYRIGWGSYPPYRGGYQTLSGGELRAGVDIPLWRDGPIDARRAKIERTRLGVEAAQQRRDLALLAVQRAAARTYWSWVAAGLRRDVTRALLELAERRDVGLRELAAAGAVESMQLVDNRRLILDRTTRAIDAERRFQEAAIALSLYLRDDQLAPVVPDERQAPRSIAAPRALALPPIERDIEDAMNRRPDVIAAQTSRRAAAVQLRLARNQRAPAINLQSFVAKDLGEGPAQLRPVEWGAGVVFELPLALREARGASSPALALAALDRHRQAFADGQLGSERELLRVKALCQLDRRDEAETVASALQQRGRVETSRILELCPGLNLDGRNGEPAGTNN